MAESIRNVCKNLEESYMLEVLDDASESNEETVNPLKITHDDGIKNERNCEHNVDENASNSYEISIDHLMNYLTDDNPNLEKTSTKQESDVQPTIATKKSKTKSIEHIPDLLSSLRSQKLKSEINYLKSKTKFYAQETERLNFERTFLLLRTKKLRLDIKKLKN